MKKLKPLRYNIFGNSEVLHEASSTVGMRDSKTNKNETCINVLSYVISVLHINKGHSICSSVAIILMYSPIGVILKLIIYRL